MAPMKPENADQTHHHDQNLPIRTILYIIPQDSTKPNIV